MFLIGCVLVAALPASAGEPLTMRLTPSMAAAPAFLMVRTSIESDRDNRLIEVVVQSADFYTSSTMALNGSHAPRIANFNFSNLPTGTYEVTATLVGSNGRRGGAAGWFRSVSSPGR
jgi:hypothetical protein